MDESESSQYSKNGKITAITPKGSPSKIVHFSPFFNGNQCHFLKSGQSDVHLQIHNSDFQLNRFKRYKVMKNLDIFLPIIQANQCNFCTFFSEFRALCELAARSLFIICTHSSEIRSLRSTNCSSKTLQNLLYFMYKSTHVFFFVFHFVQLYFLPYECPGLCRHRPGHS